MENVAYFATFLSINRLKPSCGDEKKGLPRRTGPFCELSECDVYSSTAAWAAANRC